MRVHPRKMKVPMAPTSLKQYTRQARKMSPQRVVLYTRLNLYRFAKKIVAERPAHLLVPYGKAYFLFREILQDLALQGLSHGMLKVMNFPDRVLIHRIEPALETGKASLVVDSIRRGYEIAYLTETLEDGGIEITRIFSYLTNIIGLQRLQSAGFPIEKILSYKTVRSSSRYRQAYNRVQIYLQSHVEPLVEGATYDIYLASRKMREKSFISLAEKSISRAMMCSDIKLEKDRELHLLDNIQTYSFDCVEVNKCTKNVSLFNSVPHMKKLDFEAFKLGLKVRCGKESMVFRVAVLCPLDCTLRRIVPVRTTRCKYTKIQGGKCELMKFLRGQRDIAKKTICPICINNIVSSNILDRIKNKVSIQLQKRDIDFSSRRFNPIWVSP